METKNEPIPNEIVAATAAEPEYQVLGIDLTRPENADNPIDWTQHIARVEVEPVQCVQQCMLCENTRNVGSGWYSPHPWICDECKEAIAYIKAVKKWRGDSLLHG